MPGVKRKFTPAQVQPSNRETRSSRTTRSGNSNHAPRGGLSRIVTLSTRGARGRETRNSRGRLSNASTLNQSNGPHAHASPQDPVTPRKRAKKDGPEPVEETPRTTRQSSRLKAQTSFASHENNGDINGQLEEDRLQASPSVAAASNRKTQNKNKKTSSFDGPNDAFLGPDDAGVALGTEASEPKTSSQPGKDRSSSSKPKMEEEKESPRDHLSEECVNGTVEKLSSIVGPSTRSLRKRKSAKTEDNNAPVSSPASQKQRKDKNDELDRSLKEQLQSGPSQETEDHSPVGPVIKYNNLENVHRQGTEETDESTPAEGTDATSNGVTRVGGRGGGRGNRTRGGRSRARARGGARNRGPTATTRGRGGARARSGRARIQAENSSDIEFERHSSPPSETTQKLRERQRELDKAFKRVTLAQRLALGVLAAQSHECLARDKHAHENVPEWEEVEKLLKKNLERRREVSRIYYNLRVEQENRLYEAHKEIIENRFKASALNIQDEHLKASQGAYMGFVEGVHVAEDEEHTETDGSEKEFESEPLFVGQKDSVRGFNSSFVRDLAGAADYDRASTGWDDFIHRAKMGGEVKEMSHGGSPVAGLNAPDIIAMLIAATSTVELQEAVKGNDDFREQPRAVNPVRPDGLLALAEMATTTTTTTTTQIPPRQANDIAGPHPHSHPPLPAAHRDIYNQSAPSSQVTTPAPVHVPAPAPAPTDLKPFALPSQSSSSSPQKQQPRRLLPAGRQQIPPINQQQQQQQQQFGLPDPFGGIAVRPQLQLPLPPSQAAPNFHHPQQPPSVPGAYLPLQSSHTSPPRGYSQQQFYFPSHGPPPPPPPPPPAGFRRAY